MAPVKLFKLYILLCYFVLIAGGSWYFGNYAQREKTPQESSDYFKQTVLKAKKGMNLEQRIEYDKTAGLSDSKGNW